MRRLLARTNIGYFRSACGQIYAGHQIRYEYDALGSLLAREHRGVATTPGDDATRPFIERREYLWDGSHLMAEVGKAQDGTLRWRKSYVPGASGLDDAVQQRVEIYSLSGADVVSDTLYTLLRDEQNTVVALVEEKDGADPRSPPTPVRYHYTPYGEAHAETGAELLSARFDSSLKSVTKPDGATVSQTTGPDGVDGGIRLALTLPPDPATLAAGLLVERRNTDGTWGALTAAELALGQRPGAPEELELLPTSGFAKGETYRVRYQGLRDSLGRPATSQNFAIDIPADGTPVLLDRAFPLVYDSYLASGTTANGAFPGGQNLLFQGLWTDPVTGMGYARNRWYDARNAVFLTEDPLDDIDSPNVYGFVAGRPHELTDPEGLLSASNAAKAGAKTLARNLATIGGIGVVTGLCPPCGVALAIGATGYLAYGVQSDVNERLKQGQNGAQATAGALGNVTGIGGIAEGITNKDFATGAELNLTDEEREKRIGEGAGNLLSWFAGPKAFKEGARLGAGAKARFQAWRATENTWPSIKPEGGWEFESADSTPPSPNRGVHWVEESATAGPRADAYQRAAPGARSNVASRRPEVPALRFDNPNPRGVNEVRFDGIDEGVLVDRKLSVTSRSKQTRDLARMNEALRQNPAARARIEVPTEAARRDAIARLRKLGVRIRVVVKPEP